MRCDVCGNEYENCFTLSQSGETYVFDCFECAIHAVAPTCAHCGCKIVGHGVSRDDEVFCGAHCTRAAVGAEPEADEDEFDVEEGELELDDEDGDVDDDLDDESALDEDTARRMPRR